MPGFRFGASRARGPAAGSSPSPRVRVFPGLAGAPFVVLAFAYVRAPSLRAVAPREGPSAGGYVAWIVGDNLKTFGDETGSAVRCLFAWSAADAVARHSPPASAVSSTLAACEAPPAPTASGRDVRAFAVDVGSHALGWSEIGSALIAWPASLRVGPSVTPSVVLSAGGVFVRLRPIVPSLRGGGVVPRGSVGPVAARVESSTRSGA